MATRAEPNVQHVPHAKQVRNQRHRKYDDTLDRNGNLVNIAGDGKNAHRNQQKHGGYGDPSHVGSQIRMGLHSIPQLTSDRAKPESLPGRWQTGPPATPPGPSRTTAPSETARPASATSAARGPASAPGPRPGQ